MIPRIIHQVWLRGGKLPTELQGNVDRLKSLNPAWDHIIWSGAEAEAFIKRSYGAEMLEKYLSINPEYAAPRSDFLRHLILLRHGGVYFDIKSGASKPLDEALYPDDEYVLTQWPEHHPASFPHRILAHVPGGEYCTWFIACRPDHRFTHAMVAAMLANMAKYGPFSPVGRNAALKFGGPIAYTLALHPRLTRYAHRFVTFDQLGLYFSIENYNHLTVFPNHYSKQTTPLMKLSTLETAVSHVVNSVRTLKETASSS